MLSALLLASLLPAACVQLPSPPAGHSCARLRHADLLRTSQPFYDGSSRRASACPHDVRSIARSLAPCVAPHPFTLCGRGIGPADQWYTCDAPTEDPTITCFLAPEWMDLKPGSYLCTE